MVLPIKKNWSCTVYFTILGLASDSYSAGFFGIHGFSFFLTSLILLWVVQEFFTESVFMLFLLAVFGNLLAHLFSALFFYMAEGQIYLQSEYNITIFLYNILPTSLVCIPAYYLFKKIADIIK